jgi:ABC-type cobalamin transport system ATPase subunit
MTNRSHGRDSGVWQWLFDQGEDRLAQLAEELSKNKALTDALGRALKQAARTKGQFDRNMQTVLGLFNVPSKGDYQKLLTKIETLQGSLVNVNMKLDRVLATLAKPGPDTKKKSAGKPHHPGREGDRLP